MKVFPVVRRSLVIALAALAFASACGKKDPKLPAPGSAEPDKFLFDHGTQLLQQKNWIAAREYFRKIVDNYPNSPYRQDAKLGIGDAYLGEGRIESVILGANEFKEFLQYFPLNRKADYAQSRLCYAGSKQMLSSQRDQTATETAIKECDTFLNNQAYAASMYRPDVEKIRRQAQDRLSQHAFEVGVTYLRQRYPPGAISRFLQVLADDPGYTKKDEVYYFLGEAYMKADRKVEALPIYQRLLTEYPNSKYAKKAQERVKKLQDIKR
jgi:outer membrane protein assembly factor BamD